MSEHTMATGPLQGLRVLDISTMLAEAHGVPARRVTKREEVDEAIAWARSIKGPTVLEFKVEREDAVYPMVPAGAALHEMLQRPEKA